LAQGAATEAGKNAWTGFKRLTHLVRTKLSDHPEATAALAVLDEPAQGPVQQRVLVDALVSAAGSDGAFWEELERLVTEAKADPVAGGIVTQVFGNARVGKVTNIGVVGGNVTF
jgi:uncharacterized membrane protein YebE (DUF533 family)